MTYGKEFFEYIIRLLHLWQTVITMLNIITTLLYFQRWLRHSTLHKLNGIGENIVKQMTSEISPFLETDAMHIIFLILILLLFFFFFHSTKLRAVVTWEIAWG